MLVDLSGFNIFGLKSIDALIILALIYSFAITFYTVPKVMRKMKLAGKVGVDVNKKVQPKIPELGGIASLYGISLGLAIVLGIQSMFNWGDHRMPILATLGVAMIAAFIGLIDDISDLSPQSKVLYMMLAGIPLIAVVPREATISVPFVTTLEFTASYGLYLLFWVIIVPIGITGAANAINLTGGCNGLPSGPLSVVSFTLLLISYIQSPRNASTIIFAALFGASLALYYYNKYPAKTFVGNAGSFGLGAAIGAGVIIGKVEVYGIICILPAFYEFFSTLYYGKKKLSTRHIWRHPIVSADGTIKPPPGSEKYVLRYFILSKKPMTEKRLANTIISLYVVCGVSALALYTLTMLLG